MQAWSSWDLGRVGSWKIAEDGQSAGDSDHWLLDPVCAIWCKFLAENPETDAWLVWRWCSCLLTAGTVGVFVAFVSCLLDHTCAKEQRARQWLHPSRPWDVLAQTMTKLSHAFCCAFFLVVAEPPPERCNFIHSVLCEPVEMEDTPEDKSRCLSFCPPKCVCKLRLKVEISSPSLAPSAMEKHFTSSTPWIVRQGDAAECFLLPACVSFCLTFLLSLFASSFVGWGGIRASRHFGSPFFEFMSRSRCWFPSPLDICVPSVPSCLPTGPSSYFACLLWAGSEDFGSHPFVLSPQFCHC